jgi:nicotinate phosphoribosyltransferase
MHTMVRILLDEGRHETPCVFGCFPRQIPFNGGYILSGGLEQFAETLNRFKFRTPALDHLANQRGRKGAVLFPDYYLRYLENLKVDFDLDVLPESSVAFPFELFYRYKGKFAPIQLLEAATMLSTGYPTAVATKASRMVLQIGQGQLILEYGMRRAPGIDGAMTATRSSIAGGFHGTSNEMAAFVLKVRATGTLGHSAIMAHRDQILAFLYSVMSYPDDAILLVDTVTTESGVQDAIIVAKLLLEIARQLGIELGLVGIRLDSGDLTALSIYARNELDKQGLEQVIIVAENELDEFKIAAMRAEGARIDAWGVGTVLVNPGPIDIVMKLLLIADETGAWRYPIKVSGNELKTTIPGMLNTRRFIGPDGMYIGDVIFDELNMPTGRWIAKDRLSPTLSARYKQDASFIDQLVPFRRGEEFVYDFPTLDAVTRRGISELARLEGRVKRLNSPHIYPAYLEEGLYNRRSHLIANAKADAEDTLDAVAAGAYAPLALSKIPLQNMVQVLTNFGLDKQKIGSALSNLGRPVNDDVLQALFTV